MGAPSRDQIERFRTDGFLVVPDLLSAAEVAALRQEAAAICRGARGSIAGLVGAPAGVSDEEATSRYLCVHFPHKISRLVRDTLAHPRISAILQGLIGPNVKCMQTMLFLKKAGKPGIAWHQDETYIPTRDRSLTAAWIAVDDATQESGCMWMLPGSHRAGILWPTRAHGSAEFDAAWESFDFPFRDEQAVPCEVRAGGAVFFGGYLLHRSLRNRTGSGFRRALACHYMSAESPLPWDWDGRLKPTPDNRDIVMVCGVDPYAFKGTEELTYPLLRAEHAGDVAHDPGKRLF